MAQAPPDPPRRRRVRLWPDSLAGQTILVLLVGLTVSNVVALGLYSIDRLRLLETLGGRAVVARVVEATRLIETAESPRFERRLARTLSGGRLQVRIGPVPLVGEDRPQARGLGAFRTRILERALVAAFAEAPDRAVRVDVAPDSLDDGPGAPAPDARPWSGDGPPFPFFGRWRGGPDRADDAWDRHHPDMPFHHGLSRLMVGDPEETALAVSVGLRDGRWLNVVARVPRPQGFWTPGALASLGLMTAVTLALSIWAVRRATRPLRGVADAARRMGVDPRRDPLPETGSREVREVARAFNDMQTRLARLVDNRTRLLAAISHDLRTPITTLRLRAEFVEDAEERARMLATLDDMEAMVAATLAFARDDATTEAARPVDLSALVAALCEDLAETGRPVTFEDPAEAEAAPAAVVRGRPTALRRAVGNLVANACTYGGGAEVSVGTVALADGPGAAVVVCDRGPGIPDEHLARVTDPFYRVEGSRARSTGGIGLGLSIVQAVADAHGGRLVLRNRPGGGLEARLEIPSGGPGAEGRAGPV
ncbi:ATP-binding protein [Roseospira navarrensis]|uniref:histidine kinase n=1 Tax=Roseospira navarrensis TaxID=140058 RepID=A0A7X2D5V5_9PROT|nr:ATP-binding protein [Roseospira navarrensis]MQX38077.1 HAMP domain-containing protein [Roseospira navarrensis]